MTRADAPKALEYNWGGFDLTAAEEAKIAALVKKAVSPHRIENSQFLELLECAVLRAGLTQPNIEFAEFSLGEAGGLVEYALEEAGDSAQCHPR